MSTKWYLMGNYVYVIRTGSFVTSAYRERWMACRDVCLDKVISTVKFIPDDKSMKTLKNIVKNTTLSDSFKSCVEKSKDIPHDWEKLYTFVHNVHVEEALINDVQEKTYSFVTFKKCDDVVFFPYAFSSKESLYLLLVTINIAIHLMTETCPRPSFDIDVINLIEINRRYFASDEPLRPLASLFVQYMSGQSNVKELCTVIEMLVRDTCPKYHIGVSEDVKINTK